MSDRRIPETCATHIRTQLNSVYDVVPQGHLQGESKAFGVGPLLAKTTRKLHELGQNLRLDNINRDLLSSGAVKHYIDDLTVTFSAAATQISW
jgi:hypothetical protein